jgi:hypothetical protein
MLSPFNKQHKLHPNVIVPTLTTYHRLLAITPTKSKTMAWDEVRKVCLDYTVNGLSVTSQLARDSTSPFRFVYVSGSSAERDQSKKPMFLGDYLLMRVSFFSSFRNSI